MKIIKLVAAAALALSSLAVSAAPAAAQRGDRWEQSDNGRHHARGDRGRHNGWRNNQRRHRATRHRVCRTVWRHHHRQRVCTWRYNRYRR
jgi:hypothetical protein